MGLGDGDAGGDMDVIGVENITKNDAKTTKKSLVDISKAGFSLRAYLALAVMMVIFAATEWQYKALSFFYGFKGIGTQYGNPKYEMSTEYP